MAPDGRMFQGGRKGELFELKQALNATTMKERKTALKRTVAAMTLGKDVSSLFTDVVKNTAGDLSMKKLVYLYIINYAQAKPDLAILIVNTFVKDAADPNPLVRALAIRTMALIPLEKITEYLCDPLHAALKDRDPYVRKTAAVCVAKMYDTNPTLAVEEGFVAELQQLLADGNPMTVANAVAALSEIAASSGTPGLLALTSTTVPRFLSAMSECTEWGQIFILDAISSYTPADPEDADMMVERIIPRLQHANAAVVLAAVRVIVGLMPQLDSDDKRSFLVKKMSAPLVTLMTGPPEMQFVALRNISLLIREYPALLSGDVRVFFASYADPLYVKAEKLAILVRLADPTNVQEVLSELTEYSGEVDVVFAQKAIECVGKIALRLSAFADKCVALLSDLLKKQVVHITEQVAMSLKDVLRAFPNQFDAVIMQLCALADQIDDPPARAALVWIVGEHADRIPTAVQMLEVMSQTVEEESASVQLQILTACVKAYLLRGPEAQRVVDQVIKYATEESENVDVRDRGCIYQRLISRGFDAAQQVVLSNKQGVEDRRATMPIELQKELLRSLSSIAAVYHKPAKRFEGARRKVPVGEPIGDLMAEEDLLGLDHSGEGTGDAPPAPAALDDAPTVAPKPVGDSLLDDILDGGAPLALPAPTPALGGDVLSSLGMGNLSIDSQPVLAADGTASTSLHAKELLSPDRGKGLSIKGSLTQKAANDFVLNLEFTNTTGAPMTDFEVQFNKNMFGLAPAAPLQVASPLAPGSAAQAQLPLKAGNPADDDKGFLLQIAVRYVPGGVVYFAEDVSDHIASVLDCRNGLLAKPAYLSAWKSVPDTTEVTSPVNFGSDLPGSVDLLSQKLQAGGIFTVAKRMSAKPPVLYLSSVLVGPAKRAIMAELTLPGNSATNTGSIASRSTVAGGRNSAALRSFNELCGRLVER